MSVVPLEDRIYVLLQSSADLTALVGSRISPGKAKQGCARPYVEFALAGTGRSYMHDGVLDMDDTIVQIDCWADDYDSARACNAAVVDALLQSDSPPVGLYCFLEQDGADDYDYELRRHRVMTQARVWYREGADGTVPVPSVGVERTQAFAAQTLAVGQTLTLNCDPISNGTLGKLVQILLTSNANCYWTINRVLGSDITLIAQLVTNDSTELYVSPGGHVDEEQAGGYFQIVATDITGQPQTISATVDWKETIA